MISPASIINTLHHPDIMLPLIGSVLAGSLIGAEREFQGKPAGLRTHVLVCFASALMTLAALRMGEWTAFLPEGTQIVSDMSRMPHAILTGIGFLGAGVIFREGVSVQGLTTAASLWLTAAIGITFGTGLLELAAISTIIAFLVLLALRLARNLSPLRPELSFEIEMSSAVPLDFAPIENLMRRMDLKAGTPTISRGFNGAGWGYNVLVAVRSKSFDMHKVAEEFSNEPTIAAFRISPIKDDSTNIR